MVQHCPRVGLRCLSASTPRSCVAGTALITTVHLNPTAGVVCRNRISFQPGSAHKSYSSCRFRTAHRKDPCRGLTLHEASMWCHTSGTEPGSCAAVLHMWHYRSSRAGLLCITAPSQDTLSPTRSCGRRLPLHSSHQKSSSRHIPG